MKAVHAIQIYKEHVATLGGMIDGVKDDISHFLKGTVKWIESFQHSQEEVQLSDLENQLKNL